MGGIDIGARAVRPPGLIETPPTPDIAMSHDPLSDVLRSVRLRGAVFYYVSFDGEWAAETPPAPLLAGALMPGSDHVLAYHLMAKGEGWAACNGQPPVRLAPGDIVMFPRGDGHVISSAPGLHAKEDQSDWRYVTRNDPKPIAVAYHRGVLRPGLPGPADDARSVVVCGFVACDMKPFNPLINALPHQMHLRAGDLGPWTVQLLDQAVAESREHRAGSAAVLERASEFVFVDAARRYLDSLPEGSTGWLGALRDRHVGQAIALMHERPAEPWTVDELGRQVGLSRSALHQRFVELTGQAPMQYLTNWRMQLGAGLLRRGQAKVAAVAQEVGYDSEAAFARAFKRLVGQPPAAWRRAQTG